MVALFTDRPAFLLCLAQWSSRHASLRKSMKSFRLLTKYCQTPAYSPLSLTTPRGSRTGYWFDIHPHDHNYYHILVGGGFNPYLFSTQLTPGCRGQMRSCPRRIPARPILPESLFFRLSVFPGTKDAEGHVRIHVSETFNKVFVIQAHGPFSSINGNKGFNGY